MWRDIRPSSRDYKIGKLQASWYKLVIRHAQVNDQQLLFHEQAGGDDGLGPARSQESGKCCQKMAVAQFVSGRINSALQGTVL